MPAKAGDHGNCDILLRARTSKPTVWSWQGRYLNEGVAGLEYYRETRFKVTTRTVQETPSNATHWSRTLIPEAMRISPSSVGRIWAKAGLKPHVIMGLKISNDPMFEEKVTEIVGLYVDPPDRAVVLCVDERLQNRCSTGRNPG